MSTNKVQAIDISYNQINDISPKLSPPKLSNKCRSLTNIQNSNSSIKQSTKNKSLKTKLALCNTIC